MTPPRTRVLVVDDHPDAARLVGKLVRSAGYEVAEISDHQLAVATLLNETDPIDAVVASFTTSGTRASLRLLDVLRAHPDPAVNCLRVLLVSDQPRQQIFCLQAGADAILLRPYRAEALLDALAEMLARPERDRDRFRRGKIEELKQQWPHALDPRSGPERDPGSVDRVG